MHAGRLAAADVEDAIVRPRVFQHQHVGARHVADVYVIAQLAAVFVGHRAVAGQHARDKDPADA